MYIEIRQNPNGRKIKGKGKIGACGSIVIEALCYKPEGCGFETP
jgi:hypothetical protein